MIKGIVEIIELQIESAQPPTPFPAKEQLKAPPLAYSKEVPTIVGGGGTYLGDINWSAK